jgi:hypothetical protein
MGTSIALGPGSPGSQCIKVLDPWTTREVEGEGKAGREEEQWGNRVTEELTMIQVHDIHVWKCHDDI